MKTYLFYDTETSGLNPAFDQILTFASIRTDKNFNEIERKSFTIQLRPDIVPSPKAFIVNRLKFDELKVGLSEYEAIKEIHRIVNMSGTVSLGYNTLKFDDEFLRFSFYRNLLSPYTHQYYNGCSRMDVLPLTALFYVFKPEILNWPIENGKVSLKLEKICLENTLVASGRAHEAMTDVEATCNLTRIFLREREMFKYSLDFFNKQADEIRINKIDTSIKIQGFNFKLGIMVSHQFGPDSNYMALVIDIGKSSIYPNQNIWLRIDREPLLEFVLKPEESIPLIVRKRFGDVPIVLPAIERFYEKILDENIKIAESNIKTILDNSTDFFEIVYFHRKYKYPYIPDIDPDAELYQAGFFTKVEKKDIADFHITSVENKMETVKSMKNNRIKTIAHRIMQRNFLSKIDTFEYSEFVELIKKLRSPELDCVVKGYRNDTKLNCKDAIIELEEVMNLDLDNEQKDIVYWLKNYIKNF